MNIKGSKILQNCIMVSSDRVRRKICVSFLYIYKTW